MPISIFELFKVGIGPSSSHTVGPMRAARRFAEDLEANARLTRAESVSVELYGSLALTGKGHGTDRAILLGLSGEVPDQIDPATIERKLARMREQRSLRLLGTHTIAFDPDRHLIFRGAETLPGHSNGMRFTAYDARQQKLDQRVFYSMGGGFIVAEGEDEDERSDSVDEGAIPYPFGSAAALIALGQKHGKSIWELVLENEKCWRSEAEVRRSIAYIWQVMKECTGSAVDSV